MKIGFFKLEAWEKEYIENSEILKKLDVEVVFVDEVLDKDHVPSQSDFDIVSTFVNSSIDKNVIEALPNLKYIVTRSTGYDHIDLAACSKRNILVSNVPSYGEHTVAEYTFGLILALVRKIYHSYDRIRETGSFDLEGMRGIDLRGKTIGVIGTGKIGKNVVCLAKGFNMRVLVCDAYPDEKFAEEMKIGYCESVRILEESDIITLHVPYTKETHHLINQKNIFQMKRGAYLINTSRGAIVETEALLKALKQEHLGGAALDVLEEEGVIRDELDFLLQSRSDSPSLRTVLADHVLIDMPNVIITPHNAFNTWEALGRILDTTLCNIKSFTQGKPVNLV